MIAPILAVVLVVSLLLALPVIPVSGAPVLGIVAVLLVRPVVPVLEGLLVPVGPGLGGTPLAGIAAWNGGSLCVAVRGGTGRGAGGLWHGASGAVGALAPEPHPERV